MTVQDSGRRAVRARYVVGCDGANSFVRSHLMPRSPISGSSSTGSSSISFHTTARVGAAQLATVRSGAADDDRVRRPGRRRWEFMRLPGESIEDLNNEHTAWRLLEPWDITPQTRRSNGTPSTRSRPAGWTSGAGAASPRRRCGASDAAVCGARDVRWNSRRRQSRVEARPRARRQGARRVARHVPSERIPQVRQTINFSIELGKVICVPDPAAAAARDSAMVAAVKQTGASPPLPSPAIGPGVLLAGDALAGHLFVQATVRRGDPAGSTMSSAAAGRCSAPRCDPAAEPRPPRDGILRSLGGISAHVGPDGPGARRRRHHAWFATHGVDVVLQRPTSTSSGRRPPTASASCSGGCGQAVG